MTHFLLYNKPHGNVSGCTLAIVGALPTYISKEKYTGRLQVSGARGNVTLTSWTGTLPPGAQVSYDNGTQQIVVTWPAYSPGSNADILNLDFQSGDVGFADGAGIDIENLPAQSPVDPAAPGNTWYMHYQNVGGESNAMSQAYIRAVPGKTYTASVDLWRASTRKHADGGAVRILFYDSGKVQIDGQDGNVVKEQTDRQWHTSGVSKVAPANAAFVRLGVSFFRIHDNDPVLATNLTWNGAFEDGTQAQGTDGTGAYSVTFSVRDSMGCRATWQGEASPEPGQTIASLDFNDGYTDSTGRTWGVRTADITDPYGQRPATVPYLSADFAAEGTGMTVLPDVAFHPYAQSGAQTDAYTILDDTDAINTGDFCIEMYARLNAHGGGTNEGSALCGLARGNADMADIGLYPYDYLWWVAIRWGSLGATYELNLYGGTATVTPPATMYFPAGEQTHVAMTRQGDVARVWVAGALLAEWTGASGMLVNELAGRPCRLHLGTRGRSTTAGYLAWPGQIDDVRITRGWARYTAPFTPPAP